MGDHENDFHANEKRYLDQRDKAIKDALEWKKQYLAEWGIRKKLDKALETAIEGLEFYEFPLQTAWHNSEEIKKAREAAGKIEVWAPARQALQHIHKILGEGDDS